MARIGIALVCGALVSVTLGAPADAADIAIKSFSVSPAKVSASGGRITFKARTSGATSCSLRSSVKLKSLPVTVSCASGTSTKSITIPKLASTQNKTFVFTFTARKGGLATTAKVSVVRLASAPKIDKILHSIRAGSTSDSLRIRATVHYAKTCTLSVSPAVAGLPASLSCANGTFFKATSIPRNTTASARVYTVKLTAISPTGVKKALTARVSQPGTGKPLPAISQYSVDPSTLSAAGGSYTVRAAVTNADTCSLKITPTLSTQPAPADCAKGTYAKAITVPANTGTAAKKYTFAFTATNGSGSAGAVLTLDQPAPPPPAPSIADFASTPVTFPAAGGPATVSATIAHGATCTLTSSPDLGLSTASFPCTATSVSRGLTVPADNGADRTYTFTLKVTGPGGTATGTLSVGQLGAAPAITDYALAPSTVTQAGGTFTVSAALANTTHCTFTTSPDLGGGVDGPCSGSFSTQLTVPANTTSADRTFTFTLVASGAGGTTAATQRISFVQHPAAPGITGFATSPATLTDAGGSVTLNATVVRGSTCTLTSTPATGLSAASFPCTGSSVSKTATVPVNTGSSSIEYDFTLTVTGPGGTARQTISRVQPPKGSSAPAPTITGYKATPATIGASGGTLTFTAAVANATSCTFTPTASLGAPTTANCSAGSFSTSVAVPANTSGSTKTYTFTLDVTGPGGSASSTKTITQPAQSVSVSNPTISPSTVTSAGGSFTLGATVANATGCTLTSNPDLGLSSTPFACDGAVSKQVSIPANTSAAAKSYTITLTVSGPGGPVHADYPITVPAAPPTISNFATSPTSIPAAGLAKLTITAAVTNATTCTFSASPSSLLGDPDVQSCSSGAVSSYGAVPANHTGASRQLTFTLKVDGPGGSKSQSVVFTQPST